MGIFSFLGGIIGGSKAAKASKKATAAQVQAQQLAIDEQRRQYDLSRSDFSPYLNTGTQALGAQRDLLGLGDGGTDWASYVQNNPDALANWNAIQGTSDAAPFDGDLAKFGQYHYGQDGSRRDISGFTTTADQAQQTALDELKASPFYQSLYRTGEESTLQNAAATGGIRGGNTQRALADFGADTFAATIQNQLQNLSGLSNMGLGATNSIASIGQNTANSVGTSLNAQGAARASDFLTRGGIASQNWNNAGSFLDDAVKKIAGGGGF